MENLKNWINKEFFHKIFTYILIDTPKKVIDFSRLKDDCIGDIYTIYKHKKINIFTQLSAYRFPIKIYFELENLNNQKFMDKLKKYEVKNVKT